MTMSDEYHTVRRRLKKVAGDVLSGMVGGGADDGGGGEPILVNAPQQQPMLQVPETLFEFYSDGLLATAFFIAAIIAARR
jgi:hypothetical protein